MQSSLWQIGISETGKNISQNIKILFSKIKATKHSLFLSIFIYTVGSYVIVAIWPVNVYPSNHSIKVVTVYRANLTSIRCKYSRSNIKLPFWEKITYQFSKQMLSSCINCTLTFYCNVFFPSRNEAFIWKLFVAFMALFVRHFAATVFYLLIILTSKSPRLRLQNKKFLQLVYSLQKAILLGEDTTYACNRYELSCSLRVIPTLDEHKTHRWCTIFFSVAGASLTTINGKNVRRFKYKYRSSINKTNHISTLSWKKTLFVIISIQAS